jgi:hypothetical protein
MKFYTLDFYPFILLLGVRGRSPSKNFKIKTDGPV